MDCPKCHQPTHLAPGQTQCGLCGFDLAPLQRRMGIIYVLCFAVFSSTLMYAAVVMFMETSKLTKFAELPVPAWLPYPLAAVAAGLLLAIIGLAPGLKFSSTPEILQGRFIVLLSLAEAISLLGLVLYLLMRSIPWFVAFLSLSWVAFLWAGSDLPLVVRRLGEFTVAAATESKED